MTEYILDGGTVSQTLNLVGTDTLVIDGTVTVAQSLQAPAFIATGATDIEIAAGAVLDGGFRPSGEQPLGLVNEGDGALVHGTGTFKNNLHSGIVFLNSSNSEFNGPSVTDCRSDTTINALGCGVSFYGLGSHNSLKNSTVKRCGLHGWQDYQGDDFLAEYVDVDGVYSMFGGSIWDVERATVRNCTAANTQREGFNAMLAEYVDLLQFVGREGRSDFGVSYYLTTFGHITDLKIYRSFKDGLALIGASGHVVDGLEVYDPVKAADSYVGHKAALQIEGSAGIAAEANLIKSATLYDAGKTTRFSVKEVAHSPEGVNLTRGNLVLGIKPYGYRKAPVHLSQNSCSAQRGNGQDDEYTISEEVNTPYIISPGHGATFPSGVRVSSVLRFGGVGYEVAE